MKTRQEIATEFGFNISNVFTNKTLQEMAVDRFRNKYPLNLTCYFLFSDIILYVFRPSNLEEFSKLDGVAAQRVQMYGKQFLDVIRSFCEKRDFFKKSSATTDTGSSARKDTKVCITLVR